MSKVRRRIAFVFTLLLGSAVPDLIQAQSVDRSNAAAAVVPLTVGEVARRVADTYPQVRVSREELEASAARIRLARTVYLPKIDGIAQFNRGTRNNVFGPLLPQGTLPSISGPVIGSNNGGSVWGSAVGILVNWQPFDFGYRRAGVMAAKADKSHSDALLLETQLEVGAAAADAFLTVLAAKQTEKSAAAAVDSWDALRKSTHAQAAAELRPGADESRVEAERAMAYTQLVYARQAVETSQATLGKFLVGTPAPTTLDDELIASSLPVVPETPALSVSQHPALLAQNALVAKSQAQLHAVERSWVPQFNLEAAGYARGSGADTNGVRLSGAGGLAPNVPNYVAGINIAFPFMDFASTHAREAEQSAVLNANQARADLTQRQITEEITKALAAWKAAQEVAGATPIEVRSAHTAFDQANARYKAGLAAIDDVAQTQRLVVQAEIDDAIARLNVWRAFLQYNAACGDLQPFLQAVGR